MARAQAALVALLYVFLCTFGTLTHVHTPEESQTSAPSQSLVTSGSNVSTVSRPTVSAKADTTHSKTHLLAAKSTLHCSFCDWQANSLARIVLPLHLIAPASFVCFYLPTTESCAFQAAPRAASRAPPLA